MSYSGMPRYSQSGCDRRDWVNENILADALFNLEAIFEVDDYLFAYRDDLSDQRSDAEIASLVKLLELDSPMKILDLACGFGRHTNRLAALVNIVYDDPKKIHYGLIPVQ